MLRFASLFSCLLASCTPSELQLGEPCVLNSECRAPYVCLRGRCRVECVSSRDCPDGTACALDSAMLGSCLLIEENDCALSSDCPAGLECIMQRCRNPCEEDRDCPAGRICAFDEFRGRMCVATSKTVCAPSCDPLDERCCANACVPVAVPLSLDGRADPSFANCGACDARCDPVLSDGCRRRTTALDVPACSCGAELPCADGLRCFRRPGATAAVCGDPTSDGDSCGPDALVCPVVCGRSTCVDAVAIAAGASMSCAVVADGRTYCWGGCYRQGDLEECAPGGARVPALLPSTTGLVQVGLPGTHVSPYDTWFAYGVDFAGALHQWNGIDLVLPPELSPSVVDPIAFIVPGRTHACALARDRTAQCFGANGFGQLGDGSVDPAASAVTVSGLTDVVDVSAGELHSCAVIGDGTAYCWGYGIDGQLGSDAAGLRCGPGIDSCSNTPLAVSGLPVVDRVAAGDAFTCALARDGRVFCWGANGSSELGAAGPDTFVPQEVPGIDDAIDLDAAVSYACAVRRDTSVWCWGLNEREQLGRADRTDYSPGPVQGVTGATRVATGDKHACAITATGVWCWGANQDYEVGIGVSDYASPPIRVQFPRP